MTSLPITLTDGFTPVIKEGDTVKAGDTLAVKSHKGEETINLAGEFGIPIKRVNKTLRKNPGDKVKKGDILAIKSGTFGFGGERIICNVNGFVDRYERDSGILVIKLGESVIDKENTDKNEADEQLFSPIEGTIAMCNNSQIVIKTEKDVLTGRIGLGASGQGAVLVLDMEKTAKAPETETNESFLLKLTARLAGNVIIGRELTRDMILKADSIGIQGMIGTGISDADYADLENRSVSMPVIIIDESDRGKLVDWEGKKVYIDGNTKTILFLKL